MPLTVNVPASSITVADAAMIAALQADGYIVTLAPPVVVTPPPPTPPAAATGGDVVLTDGILNKLFGWVADWSFGVASVTYGATAPDGTKCLEIESNAAQGGGGWLPYFIIPGQSNAGGFPPLPFLNLTMQATRAGQTWVTGVDGTGDVALPGVPGSIPVNASPPAVNAWVTYKVAMPIPAGDTIEKFEVADQMPWVAATKANAPGNIWRIKDAWWSTT